jgi:adenylate cyclase
MNAAKMGLRTFGRYVPVDLVRQILRSGVSPSVGGERRELTVMFSDIRAFTGIAETLAPEELIGLLSEYFQLASDAILGSGGTIDKFIGDGILALWNAPQRVENHEAQACRCALEMQRKIGIFNEQQRSRAKPTLETRIGIHTGVAIVGNVGTAARLDYTALGDIVNIAARLEQINKTYGTGIIVSGAVEKAVGEAFIFRHLGEVSLKGRRRLVRIFELSGEVQKG